MSVNAVVGFPRWTEKITFSGGSWESDYPLSNLKVLPLAQIARSADLTTANTQFVATLDKARGVRLLALVRHNLSLDARVRIRLYAESGMTTLLYDSGWEDVWTEIYAYENLEWEDDNWWTGKYTEDEIEGYTWTRPFWLDQLYLCQAIKVEIDDQTNADGAVDIGMFEVAQGWQLGVNFALGSNYGYQFRTNITEAEGGVEYAERRDKPRVFKGSVNFLGRDEATAKAFEHQRQLDLDKPFLWMPNPDKPREWLQTSYLARNDDPGLMAYASFERDTIPLSFKEVI